MSCIVMVGRGFYSVVILTILQGALVRVYPYLKSWDKNILNKFNLLKWPKNPT